MLKNLNSLVVASGLMLSSLAYAGEALTHKPFYAGLNLGVGSTTWRALVPAPSKQNEAVSVSAPIRVDEGGHVYGVYAGYELTPYFALEAAFRHYAGADVIFDEYSIFSDEHDDRVNFNTHTQTASLMAKISLTIPNTIMSAYSSFGGAIVKRRDELAREFQFSPTFGAGLNFEIAQRFVLDVGFNYTAGYGESELSPANSFIPFLYSGTIGLAYRFC